MPHLVRTDLRTGGTQCIGGWSLQRSTELPGGKRPNVPFVPAHSAVSERQLSGSSTDSSHGRWEGASLIGGLGQRQPMENE